MISVVLVTYNSMKVLSKCLESLVRCSSAAELEIIIVDNASTDETPQWITKYCDVLGELPFVGMKTVFQRENKGYAFANNRGLEIATGDILLLLNPDTVVSERAIARCVEILGRDSTVGAIGCRLELPDGTLDRACRRSLPTMWNSFARLSGLSLVFPRTRWFASYNLSYLDERGSYPVDCLCGAFLMITRETYQHVGGLDEDFFMYGEDIDWCYRIRRHDFLIWYEGGVSTLHIKGGNGGKRSRQSLRYFYDTMYLYYVKTLGHDRSAPTAILIALILRLFYYVHVLAKGI